MSVRIWDKDHRNEIILELTDAGFELTAWEPQGDGEVTVTLDARGVRNLRLAIQRLEREMTKAAPASEDTWRDTGSGPGYAP